MTLDPKKVLDDLKASATKRKRASLDLIYGILEQQIENGQRDFSIATIGRLSADAHGPSPQAIRNKGGADYRRIIEVWAIAHNATTKKPLPRGSRGMIPKRDEDILKLIEDPALRAVVGAIIAERNRFRKELRVLKSQTELTIDRRPEIRGIVPTVEMFPSLSELLNDIEREALRNSISEKLLEERGWKTFDNGRVKDQNNRHLYKPGYVTAIQKILMEVCNG